MEIVSVDHFMLVKDLAHEVLEDAHLIFITINDLMAETLARS